MTTQYVALLRGINVGGNNIIPMAQLRDAVTGIGARNVATYIQSGNVLFDGGRAAGATWVKRLEAGLADRFSYSARVMVRSHGEMQAIIANAPAGFGESPDDHKYDVLFLSHALTAGAALDQLPTRPEVDSAWAGEQVIYFSRVAALASKSYLHKLAGLPVYKETTVRNWRTTTTLLRMLDDRVG